MTARAAGLPAVRLGTKAQTLAWLAPHVTRARVLPLACFDRARWTDRRADTLDDVLSRDWAGGPLIVRSSALAEDSAVSAQAGRFLSRPAGNGRHELASAVDDVLGSYDPAVPGDQVLVQPYLTGVLAGGVAHTCEPGSGAPYRIVEWTESGATDTVTGGSAARLETSVAAPGAAWRDAPGRMGSLPARVGALLDELAELTGVAHLDVEFAVDSRGDLVLFQARRLVTSCAPVPPAVHRATLDRTARQVTAAGDRSSRILGSTPLYGVMPDWNPAEIIGLRPRRLSTSLYRHLVTDGAWAAARHRQGYRDLRGVPLLVELCGLPYVDVRASLTSLVPGGVPDDLAGELVDHAVRTLVAHPHLHDKIESRIVVSAHTLSTRDRLDRLGALSARDRALVADRLRALTDRLVGGTRWERDAARARTLETAGPHPAGILAQLDRCRADGTEPFAALARAAFVATDFLDDLVAGGVLSADHREAFVAGLGLVTTSMSEDFARLDRPEFLRRYGHLRPGTYDIRTPRYDEAPDLYFDWSVPRPARPPAPAVDLSGSQRRRVDRLLVREGLAFGADRLLEFVRGALVGRERAKFAFSAQLSDALRRLARLGDRLGLGPDELSHVDVATIAALTGRDDTDRALLTDAVAEGRARLAVSDTVVLPPLVRDERDVWSFVAPKTRPNFVGRGRVVGPVADVGAGRPPDGAIAAVVNADPGYDWIFTRGVTGLVTAYGGANSHMAVRALETGVPAVVGAGEALFRTWRSARRLSIDAAAGVVRVLP